MPTLRRRVTKSVHRGGDFINLRSRKVLRTPTTSSRLVAYKSIKPSKALSDAVEAEVSTASCVVCGDDENIPRSGDWIKAPCTHAYCPQCAQILITTYVHDESLHPIRCCKKPIPKKYVDKFLSKMGNREEHSLFQDKYEEYSIPARKRTYCPARLCYKFIPPRLVTSTSKRNIACPFCSSEFCKRCKLLAHAGGDCEADHQTALFQKLVKRKKWQACNKCGQMIERIDGCRNMTCRCGNNFCYGCGGTGLRCQCP